MSNLDNVKVDDLSLCVSVTKSIPLYIEKINQPVQIVADNLKVQISSEKPLSVEPVSNMILELRGKPYKAYEIRADGSIISDMPGLRVTDIRMVEGPWIGVTTNLPKKYRGFIHGGSPQTILLYEL